MMNEKGPTIYDKTEFYEKEIQPRIDEIKKLCRVNDVPFISCCAIANTDNGKTVYRNDGVSTGSMGVCLHDDQFERLLCVMNGFDVRPKNAVTEFDDGMLDYIDSVNEDGNTVSTNANNPASPLCDDGDL